MGEAPLDLAKIISYRTTYRSDYDLSFGTAVPPTISSIVPNLFRITSTIASFRGTRKLDLNADGPSLSTKPGVLETRRHVRVHSPVNPELLTSASQAGARAPP